MHPRGMHMGRGRGSGRGFFDHARLGAKTYRNNLNCSLEVKRIPSNQNNIMDLNSHFWRFGKIVNIQISFEGDPEAALITFSTPAEAFAAYRSTEAVLNNRFVKVFWHNKEKENEEGDGAPGTVSVKDRLGPGGESQHEAMEQDKILLSGNSLTKTVYNHNAVRKELAQEKVEAVEAIKRSQEMLAAQEVLKREQAEKKKEAMLMRNNLQKRKQDVLSEQIDQQKKLIQKIESGKGVMKPEEISQLMEIVKSLQESIEKIKLDLDKSANPIHTGQKPQNPIPAAPPSRNKEETQKEILDAELDLYNKELEGGDTLALKRKVLELRSQAQAAGLLRGRGGYRGLLRSFTNRGRGAMRSLRRVDRRPTKICITGHPLSKSSEILAHFAQYGLMENYETDPVKPSLTIKYETRKSAELAMSQGRNVQNIPLDIQWVANSVASNQDKQGSRNSTNGEEESTQEELGNGDDGDDELADAYVDQLDLYDQYEDEEDDEDDRTWRR
jgi:RNA-binding protein 26